MRRRKISSADYNAALRRSLRTTAEAVLAVVHENQRASAGFLLVVNVGLLSLHGDGRAGNATVGGGGTRHGAIDAVEFARVDVTGTRITVAPRVAGVVLTCPASCLVLSRE